MFFSCSPSPLFLISWSDDSGVRHWEEAGDDSGGDAAEAPAGETGGEGWGCPWPWELVRWMRHLNDPACVAGAQTHLPPPPWLPEDTDEKLWRIARGDDAAAPVGVVLRKVPSSPVASTKLDAISFCAAPLSDLRKSMMKTDRRRKRRPGSARARGGLVVARAASVKDEAAGTNSGGHEVLMFEALREAMIEEMTLDPTVCMIGEDVGDYGGSYKVSKGLSEMFGDLRVLDTPIAENSFTGMGVGAAMKGLRPVVEGMNMGFLLLAYNQISNNCGMLHYTSGGQFKIPIVIRGPGGVGRQLGAEHSQRLESYFQSIPGLQMVACSTPYNAKGLLKAAIRSENPVVVFEHVLLYNMKEKIPDEDYICCLEEAEMVRPGSQVTILTYSRMRYHVMQAVKTLVNKGYDPEVIDIRSLKPFDLHTIGNSVKKTHRVLIVEECMRTGGIGASLRSAIIDNFWDELDAPPMCLSSQDVPTPYAAPLEDATVVQPPQIVAAIEEICR